MEFTEFIYYRQIKAKLCYQTSYLSKSLDETVSFLVIFCFSKRLLGYFYNSH
jgi:hypothetical protein